MLWNIFLFLFKNGEFKDKLSSSEYEKIINSFSQSIVILFSLSYKDLVITFDRIQTGYAHINCLGRTVRYHKLLFVMCNARLTNVMTFVMKSNRSLRQMSFQTIRYNNKDK